MIIWSKETINLGQGYLLGLSGVVSVIPRAHLIISRAEKTSPHRLNGQEQMKSELIA